VNHVKVLPDIVLLEGLTYMTIVGSRSRFEEDYPLITNQTRFRLSQLVRSYVGETRRKMAETESITEDIHTRIAYSVDLCAPRRQDEQCVVGRRKDNACL
jgi:hypothetical protein